MSSNFYFINISFTEKNTLKVLLCFNMFFKSLYTQTRISFMIFLISLAYELSIQDLTPGVPFLIWINFTSSMDK